MANIKKNFNFRNGVQVDDDNLLVTSTGLVGIGTTVPTEALDVRGAVKIIGDANITSATVGIITITEVAPTQIIGAGVSIKSGIVTAQGTGIVTFYGDARFLQGMPTSQWEDTNAGFGVSSIYNTGGTVGIATTNPQFTLQIGENPNQIGGVSGDGVGISSVGNIKVSGIVTATTFSGGLTGDVTGNVVGVVTGSLVGNVTGNVTGDVTGNTQGIHTGAVNLGDNVKAKFGGSEDLEIYHSTASGGNSIINDTGTGNLIIGGSIVEIKNAALNQTQAAFFEGQQVDLYYGDAKKFSTSGVGVTITSQLDTTNLKVTGVSTFSGRIEGAATNNVIPFLYGNQGDLPSASSYHGAVAHVHATGALYFAHAGAWWELVNKESDGRVGTGTEVYNVASINSSGIITATTELNSPLIGVGTDTPANDIQIRKNANVEIQVTSDTGSAGLTVGRESGTNNTNNAEFRYGLVSGGAPYSSAQSLDIINYGTGNFNYHLSANNAGAVAGDFHWHKGLNSRLMTLTGIGGSLGIGITTPSAKFEVAGSSKFSGSVEITNNLTLSGALNSNLTGNVTGNLTGNVFGLIDSPVTGISTIRNLFVSQGLGIGITDSGNRLNIGSSLDNRIFINNNSQIGIKTDTISDTNVVVEILGNVRLKKAVSVGNTTRSAVDFSDAVNITNEGETGLPFNRSQLAYMIPPRVTTAQRNLLRDAHTNSATLLSGAMIYNTNLNKLQVWNGSAWETVTSS